MEELKQTYLNRLQSLEIAFIDELIARLAAHNITTAPPKPGQFANPLRLYAAQQYSRCALDYTTLDLQYENIQFSLMTDVTGFKVKLTVTTPISGVRARRLARWHTKSWELGHITKFQETIISFRAKTVPELVKKLKDKIKKSDSCKKLQLAEAQAGKLKPGNYYV